jgi:uncharacterized protein (TIGR00369 family)
MNKTIDVGQPKKSFKGFMDAMGARMTEWSPDRATIEVDVSDVHLNGIDVVHGGVMASLIDTAAAHAAIYCPVPGHVRQAMTISLNVNLVGNVKTGTLVASARIRKAGKTIFVSACDVHDQDGNLLATGEVVGRYGRGSHLPQGIPAEKFETEAGSS